MTAIEAVCDRRFRAVRTSGRRAKTDVRWIVLHDGEASTAESMARFFTLPQATGSAHLAVDDAACFRCLDNEDVPWGAVSSFNANMRGFHIEQAGLARWSAALWFSHRQTLRRAAYKTALHCVEFDLRPVWVPASQLPLHSGITTHAEISAASRRIDPKYASRYTHSDPGPLWPRRTFMRYVREYYATFSV